MLRRNPSYRRLKVDGYGPFGSATYWLGPDHLLLVVVSNYAENYQRFLFSHIQALMVSKTRHHYVWGFLFASLALGSFIGSVTVVTNSAGNQGADFRIGLFLLLAVAALFVGLLVGNWLRGPGCICHLCTDVQTLRLPCLTRWRKAKRLVAELTPLILSAQTQLGSKASVPQSG